MSAAIPRAIAALIRHRRAAAFASVAIAGALGAFATRINVDNSLEVWFVDDDPSLVAYRDFLERFGNDEVVVTAIHGSGDLFDPARLERLWRLSRDLESIEGVARVRSLANTNCVQGTVIGPAVVPIVTPPVGEDDAARARHVVEDRNLASDLVGRDGSTLVVSTWLEASPTIDRDRGRIIREIRAVTQSSLATGEHASLGGVGVLHEALNEVTLADGARFLGLSYLVIAIALYAITRRLAWTLLALVAVTAADLALFGVMTLTGRAINMITIALPPVVMILGVANVLHMSTTIDRSLARGERSVRELTRSLTTIATPCLFNTVTTAAAFLSLSAASMAVTRDYGIFAALGVVAAFVFSLVGMAASIPWAVRFRRPARLHERVADVVERVMVVSMRRRRWVLVLTLLTTAWAVYGTRQIVVDTASFEFLPPEQEARVDAAAIEEAIGPFFPLELTLQPETTGAWRSATYLLDLAGVQRELESLPAIGRTTTAGDVLREVHVAVTGEDRERLWRPDEDADVDNLLDLIGRTGHEGTLRNWVTEDDRVLRLTATTPMATAREFQMLSENVRRTVERGMGADTRVSLGGYLPLYSRIVEHTLDDQIASFTLAFVLVFAILAVVLGSWRYLLAAMPANLLPVGIVLGTMGTAGIRLDLATVTVAAVVLGIIVDDSVHILYRLRRELVEGRPLEDAVRDVARGSGVAIVSTSFVFAAGFLVIAFATSDAVALPGLLTAVAVVAALLSDLIVLPAFATFVFGWARTTGAAAPVARPRRTAAETR